MTNQLSSESNQPKEEQFIFGTLNNDHIVIEEVTRLIFDFIKGTTEILELSIVNAPTT